MFVYYALHSASLISLPFVRPALYLKAEVRPRPAVLVTVGAISVASMVYLTVTSLSLDVAKLLVLWVAVGTGLYAFARLEGRRSGFDYERQLRADWENE
jgi:hypothetical protein